MASSDIGVLTVYMDAVTDQFHAGLQGAEEAITSFRGKIKGLNRTFTEVKNKVHVIAGAFESAFKGVEVVTKLFKADLQGATDIIKELPLGIGATMTAFESMLLVVTGQAEQQERIEASIKRQQKLARDMSDILKEQVAFLSAAADRADALGQKLIVAMEELFHGPEAAAALDQAMDDAAAVAKLKGKIAELDESLIKNMEKWKEAEAAVAAAAAEIKALEDAGPQMVGMGGQGFGPDLAGHEESLRLARERLELYEATLVKAKGLTLTQEVGIHALEDELGLLEDLLETRARITAKEEKAAKDARDRADALAKQNELMAKQGELASAQAKRDRILGRGLQGAANTFTSPMGTISLPALNTTAELAREQLAELKIIEQTISGLETTIKDLTKP